MNKHIEIKIGDILGSWTITSQAPSDSAFRKRWNCKCKCGFEKIVSDHTIKIGRSKSCGTGVCHRDYVDLTGKKFTRWTVIKMSSVKKNQRSIVWEVKCDCGEIGLAITNSLNMGATKSCGCLSSDTAILTHTLPNCEAALRKIFKSYAYHAKRRNYDFEFAEETFRLMLIENCYYCEKAPSNTSSSAGGNFIYNGIDRVDNSLGYSKKNTVTCCYDCNRKKMRVSMAIALKMAEWYSSKVKFEEKL